MSYAHQRRKKRIKRGDWCHAATIERWKRQGHSTEALEVKEAARIAHASA